MKKIHLGNLLLENKIITQEQLNSAIARQQKTGEKLGKIFLDLNYIKEQDLLNLLSQQLKIPFIDLKNYSVRPEVVQILPEFYARRYRAIVLNNDDQGLLVGMADPLDLIATDELSRTLKRPFQVALVKEDELLHVVDMVYRHSTQIRSLAEELSAELKVTDYDIAQLGAGLPASDAPVVKLLQTIFEDAAQVNASDIHIEPDELVLRIRVRIDGILHEQIVKEKNVASALTLRLKLMGGLNIAEKRLPQDGRFSLKIRNMNYDVRLSTLPIQFGESVVLRLLNQSAELVNLDYIGMPVNVLERFRHAFTAPYGIILVTGPTGSGKTTTLYGALNELNTTDVKIITVEDPVEYRLPRISQVQVQTKIDLTFARVLRAMLRQDPDIIMIGELRDEETVSIALRAALTGHLVLATIHTNDAISTIARLIDMGAEEYLVATVLRAIIAQRLVRRICEKCSEVYEPTADELIWLKSVCKMQTVPEHFHMGTGCTYCHHTGYKGQIGVFEFLEFTPELADALRLKNTTEFLKVAHKTPGYKPLVLSGLDLVTAGVTTLSEVIRITGEDALNSE
jgi:MSHA biogenesis protein MshE